MSGPQTSPPASASASAAATAAATAKVQRINLWRQEVAIALCTPEGKKLTGRGKNVFWPSSLSSPQPRRPPGEQHARAQKRISFLSRLLNSRGNGISHGDEGSPNGNLPQQFSGESTAMYHMTPTSRPMTTAPQESGGKAGGSLAAMLLKGGRRRSGKSGRVVAVVTDRAMGSYGSEGEESMENADVSMNSSRSSSSSPEAGLLAREERLERAARLLRRNGGREGKG